MNYFRQGKTLFFGSYWLLGIAWRLELGIWRIFFYSDVVFRLETHFSR